MHHCNIMQNLRSATMAILTCYSQSYLCHCQGMPLSQQVSLFYAAGETWTAAWMKYNTTMLPASILLEPVGEAAGQIVSWWRMSKDMMLG